MSELPAHSDRTRGRYVVTGGSGFLGGAIVGLLRAKGFEAISISRREGVDLRDGRAATRCFQSLRPDCVIHCAAHMGGIGYVRDHGVEVYRDNLQISLGLLEGMTAAGIRNLVTIMPNCTYPGDKEVFREAEWWDGPLHDSVLMYGLPRKAFWGLCWTYAQQGLLRAAHLVLPNLYGPHDHMDPVRSHALGAILARVVTAQRNATPSIALWGTGHAVREWLYVDDAAQAVCRFASHFARPDPRLENNALFNVGMGRGISIGDLALIIRRLTGWQGTFTFDTRQPEGAVKKVLDGTRFRELCGWEPEVTLEDGIRRTLAWYREATEGGMTKPHPVDEGGGIRLGCAQPA